MFYNKYKDIITEDGKIKMTPLKALAGGMMAGCFSTIGNNPFDVVKTQMQGTQAKQYTGTLDCFTKIFKNEGPMGFYKGVIPRMGRVVPGQVRSPLRSCSFSLIIIVFTPVITNKMPNFSRPSSTSISSTNS